MQQSRADFLLARMGGIGGSSIASLLSNIIPVEYGCQRKLWFELSAYPADNPEAPTEPMLLGNILESHVAAAYSAKTGRRVEQVGLKKHPVHNSLQVHVDRIIHPAVDDKQKDRGALEIKAVGNQMMAKINETGICADYICQVNHEMLCHGLDWGAFAVGTREDLLPLAAIEMSAKLAGEAIPALPRQPKIVDFDVPRDQEICDAIEREGPRFWETLKNESKIPPRLEPEDPRCGRCNFKIRCQGAAVMEGIQTEHGVPERRDLDLLIQEYRDRSALLEEATDLVNETQRKFKTALDKTTAVKVNIEGKWKNIIYRIRKGAERVDGKRMAAQYDALRRAAIEAKVPGAELVPPSGQFINVGMPSRPLLLSSVLPKKEKKPGEVPETDEEGGFEE